MIYIIGGIFGGIAFALLLYPYYSNSGIPKSIYELTRKVEGLMVEVRELRKVIAERTEE